MKRADDRAPRPDGSAPKTLLEAFARQARREGLSRGIRLLDDRGRPTFLAYSDLLVEAAASARALDRCGLRPRDAVLLFLPTCRSAITLLVGCMLRGVLPLLVDPGAWSGVEAETASQAALALARRISARAVVVAGRRLAALAPHLGPEDPPLLAAEALRTAPAVGSEDPSPRRDPAEPALYTATAGHVSGRRPVLLSHANLLAQVEGLQRALRIGEREVLCGFAGLDSATGLVDQLFLGLHGGFDQVLLAPDWVYAQPLRWVQALSSYRCTLTVGDTNLFGHCAHRSEPHELEAIDLSCLRRAVVLGSPTRPGTHEAFLRRFSPCGLAADALLPAYALAEAGGVLTVGRPGARALADRFDRRSLQPGSSVHSAGSGDARGRLMMSCGMPLPYHEVGIRGPAGDWLDEGMVGRVTARGPAVTAGGPDTAGPGDDGWLDTGDLGFVRLGELFVVGRAGEGLELGGLRYDPEELEAVAGEVPGIRSLGATAFTVDRAEETRPVLVASPDRGLRSDQRGALAQRVGTRLGRMIGLRPEVILVPRSRLPQGIQGKALREDCRDLYLDAWAPAQDFGAATGDAPRAEDPLASAQGEDGGRPGPDAAVGEGDGGAARP